MTTLEKTVLDTYPARMGKIDQGYKSIFLSDVHLGTRASKAHLLKKFLKQCEGRVENLHLVGDILDMIQFKHKFFLNQDHVDVLRQFLKLAKQGTKVSYYAGNHDMYIRPLIKEQPALFEGIELLNSKNYESHGKTYKIIHGDELDVFMRPQFFWLSKLGGAVYDGVVTTNQALNYLRAKMGLGYWSLAQYAKNKSKTLVIDRYMNALVSMAKREEVDGVICGHIHQAANNRVDDIHYLNTGDWVDSCTALVETYEGDFYHYNWHHRLSKNGNHEE